MGSNSRAPEASDAAVPIPDRHRHFEPGTGHQLHFLRLKPVRYLIRPGESVEDVLRGCGNVRVNRMLDSDSLVILHSVEPIIVAIRRRVADRKFAGIW